MAINFPDSPNDGDLYTYDDKTWRYVSPPGIWTPVGTFVSITGATGNEYWTATGTAIYYITGPVGIGTANPGSLLDVQGNLILGTQAARATISYTTNTARTYTIPDAGSNADFVMTAGAQTIAGVKTFSSTISGSVNGSAATLTTARNINGTSFNGSADITVPGNFADRTANESGHAVFISTNATGNQAMYTNTNYRFNPSTAELSATNFNSTSDVNKKTDIQTIPNALESLLNLRGVVFKWKHTGSDSMGLIAQEVEPHVPEVVHTEGDTKTVSYGSLVGLLVESIKTQQQQIQVLQDEILMLKSQDK